MRLRPLHTTWTITQCPTSSIALHRTSSVVGHVPICLRDIPVQTPFGTGALRLAHRYGDWPPNTIGMHEK